MNLIILKKNTYKVKKNNCNIFFAVLCVFLQRVQREVQRAVKGNENSILYLSLLHAFLYCYQSDPSFFYKTFLLL